MSVHISISNLENQQFFSVMKKLYIAGIDCRSIQTTSIVKKKIIKSILNYI